MFELNRPLLDYITLTTYNPIVFETWHRELNRPQPLSNTHDARVMQYSGWRVASRDGIVFLGQGVQMGRAHYMLRASGPSAHDAFLWSKPAIEKGYVNVTRVDMQITVDYWRETWEQSALFAALRDAEPNRVVSYHESASGPVGEKLATVYYGSRQSDRVVRIYEKVGMGADVHLRFEAEFKGARAKEAVAALARGVDVSEMVRAEVERLPDVYGLHGLFLAPLSDDSYEVQLVKPEPATERWLVEQVAPALDRLLRDHDANRERVAHLFEQILSDYRSRLDHGDE